MDKASKTERSDKYSPVVKGIGIKDSMAQNQDNNPNERRLYEECEYVEENISASSNFQKDGSAVEELNTNVNQPTSTKGTRRKRDVRNVEEADSIESLQNKKLQLEIRKLELDVWKEERNLNIPHSTLTRYLR